MSHNVISYKTHSLLKKAQFIMSRDWKEKFSKHATLYDFKNVKIQSKEQTFSSDASTIIEREATVDLRDKERYFYADSKSCEVQSNDPSDLYRALDITFKATPSIFSKLITAINTLFGGYSFEEDDTTTLVSSEKNRFNKGNSKPKM